MRWVASMVVALATTASLPAFAEQVQGVVVSVVGQRVTLNDDRGQQVTLSIPDAQTLRPGDKVLVTYSVVGDALRASQVVRLPN